MLKKRKAAKKVVKPKTKKVTPKVKKPKVKRVKVSKKISRPKAKKVTPAKARRVSTPLPATAKLVGKITHYFPHVQAGVVLVTDGKISVGDTIQITGHTTDVKQEVSSLQVNNAPIQEAETGQEVGILVKSRVRHNDLVYKL